MAIINYATKEVQFKIVYYGPALCGKTTNLAYVHSQVNETNKGELVSLATAADRTLFFDFLPLNAIVIKGFKTKFQLYTVPGQVIYNATRQLVLRSVDGVVFVADSQWDKMEENVESFKNLQENLSRQGQSLDNIPFVLVGGGLGFKMGRSVKFPKGGVPHNRLLLAIAHAFGHRIDKFGHPDFCGGGALSLA